MVACTAPKRIKAPVPVEPHIQNFMDCVKSRKQPNCPVDIAAEAVTGPHLANLALFQGKRAVLAKELAES